MSKIESHDTPAATRVFRNPAQDEAILEQLRVALDPGVWLAPVHVQVP